MKIRIFGIILLAALSFNAFGQYENPDKTPDVESSKKKGINMDSKWFFGGNLGMSFGTYYSYVELAPWAGYKLSKWFWPGAGPMYLYQKASYNVYVDRSSLYGLKTLAYINVINNIGDYLPINLGSIFVYTEDDIIQVHLKRTFGDGSILQDQNWTNVFLLGGGLRFPLGQRGGISLLCLWDLSQSVYYRYNNPIIRVGFDF